MRGCIAPNRLDRIIAKKAALYSATPQSVDLTYEEVKQKLAILIQEKRFLIYVFLKTASDHGLTQQEIAAAIGTGNDRFEFHLSMLCRERILLLIHDDAGVPRFRVNPAFASAMELFFA
jgi:hypothetical protein